MLLDGCFWHTVIHRCRHISTVLRNSRSVPRHSRTIPPHTLTAPRHSRTVPQHISTVLRNSRNVPRHSRTVPPHTHCTSTQSHCTSTEYGSLLTGFSFRQKAVMFLTRPALGIGCRQKKTSTRSASVNSSRAYV